MTQAQYNKETDSEQKKEDWMNAKWRPMMGCKLPKDFPAVIKIVPYERSPDEFLICINKLIENFEKVDL